MVITNKIVGYISFALFLVFDLFIGFIFIDIHDDATTTLNLNTITTSTSMFSLVILVILLLIIQILVASYYSISSIKKEQKFEIYPVLSKTQTWHWKKYKPEEIQNLIAEVSKKAGVEVKKAYISTEIIPRVFSYNFGRGIVIILNANLIQICSPKELEAAISIELGFTKSPFTSIITYLNFSVYYFMIPLYTIPFFFLAHAIIQTWFDIQPFTFQLQRVISQVFFLFALVVLTVILWNIQEIFSKLANRNVQYIADKKATKIVGKRSMINVMVKLGQRTEAIDLLLEEIKWLESLQVGKVYPFDEKRLIEILPLFPSDELSEDVAQRIAPNIFIKSRLLVLEQTYGLEIPQIDEKIEKAAVNLREKRVKFLEEEKEKAKEQGIQKKDMKAMTIDWRKADVDGNLELDPEEIKNFIQTLKQNKKKLLFENEVSGNLLFKGRLPINKRILAVYNTHNDM